MNRTIVKSITKGAALLLTIIATAACNTGEPWASDENAQITINAQTRAILREAIIDMRSGTDIIPYKLGTDGSLTPLDERIEVPNGAKTIALSAWGTVRHAISGFPDGILMPVLYHGPETVVSWSTSASAGVNINLSPATALLRLEVTNSKGDPYPVNGVTIFGVTLPTIWGFEFRWNTNNTPPLLETGHSEDALFIDDILQILPFSVETGSKLLEVNDGGTVKSIYAMKPYGFAAGKEYTFRITISTHGEAILQNVTIKSMIDGADAGNTMYINNIADLRSFRDRVNAGETGLNAIQTADITMETTDTQGTGWMPIGTSGKPYAGTYLGKGYSINNLAINRPDKNHQSLFGYTAGAILKDIHIKDATVEGKNDVGALAGRANNTTVKGCSATSGMIKGQNNAGGLIGAIQREGLNSSSITFCFADIPVEGNEHVGGLVGSNFATIIASYATGDVKTAATSLGGLVGSNSSSSANIYFCYATGNLQGTGNVFGGLVGFNIGIITSCYATGAKNGTASIFGGLVGRQFDSGTTTFSSCTATPMIGNLNASIPIGTIGSIVRHADVQAVTINGETFDNSLWEPTVATPRLNWQITP